MPKWDFIQLEIGLNIVDPSFNQKLSAADERSDFNRNTGYHLNDVLLLAVW